MPENEGKPVRDIRFAKKKEPQAPKPFALAGPPPRPAAVPRSVRAPRAKLILSWTLLALLLVAAGGFAARRGWFLQKNSERAPTASSPLGTWIAAIRDQLSSYGIFADVSGGALRALSTADAARRILPAFLNGKQTSLVDTLKDLQNELNDLSAAAERLVKLRPDLANTFPFFGNYLSFETRVGQSETALRGIIAWLENPAPHHVIVFLGNTSELRPGGGFIGSFADLTVASGTVQNIAVRDINEVDRVRNEKVIPPMPLQAIAGRWRAADANWFFDYPSSAEKVLRFMGESDLYASTTLDGAVALTPKVFEDILAITGPIALSSSTTVDAKNVVTRLQSDVQSGQAEGAASPKAILSALAPKILDRLSSLSEAEQNDLFKKSLSWVEAKDAMFYFRDGDLAKTFRAYGADGSLYPLAENFSGDYIAPVDANIGGEKTDFVMEEHVTIQSHLDDKGIVHDTVTILRTNHGDTRSEWWYDAVNWNYFMLFTPAGVSLEDAQGIGQRFITPKADYKKGFARDPDLKAVEDTLITALDGKLQVFRESGRNVFATWQKIAPGGSKTTLLSYARALPRAPSEGMPYDFVFERQAGSKASLQLTLTAPVGFEWKDGDSVTPAYEYFSELPPGRLVLHLTLVKR